MIMVYGISNCDSVKKARDWLTAHALPHQFHDFKKSGVPDAVLPSWIAALGAPKLLNRNGTTWRNLDAATQTTAHHTPKAIALMVAQPSVIKRPLVDWGNGEITVGFDAEVWASRLSLETACAAMSNVAGQPSNAAAITFTIDLPNSALAKRSKL